MQRQHLITNEKELETALYNTLQPNSRLLKVASRQLNRFCSDPSCIEPMVRQMQRSPNVSIKQLVATLLRQRIGEYWSSVPHQRRAEMKHTLLQMLLLQDTDTRVHTALVGLVSEVAAVELTELDGWQELNQFMVQCAQHQHAQHRQMGVALFGRLIEAVPQKMVQTDISGLLSMFSALLQDQEMAVRLATLRAIESLSKEVESDGQVAQLLNLIPSVIQIIQQCIASGMDTFHYIDSFQIFDNLLERQYASFDKVLPPLVKFMFELALNSALDMALRDRALDFVTWAVSYRPNIFIHQNLVPATLDMVFALLSEPNDDDEDGDEEDENEITAYSSSSALLDEVARDIPSKHTFTHIMSRAMAHINSGETFKCRAGIAALGIIAEGCSVSMTKRLDKLLPILVGAMSHQSRTVRENAFLSLAQFSDFLVPDMMEYHEMVMPAVINGLASNPSRVVRKICCAIDAFSEYLGDHIEPYLKPLMEILLKLLTKSDRCTQEALIPSVANVSQAAEEAIVPYFATIAHFCKQLMEHARDHRDQGMLNLRAKATECIGIVAVAVGPKQFLQEWLDGFMTLALEGLTLDHVELREATFSFFSNIASMLGADFERYLPTVMKPILQSLCTEEGDAVKRIGKTKRDAGETATDQLLQDAERQKNEGKGEDNDDRDDIDDDDDNESVGDMYSEKIANDDDDDIHTALIDERTAATKAIGSFAKSCRSAFAHYLDNVLEALMFLFDHYHFVVRREVVTALRNMVFVLVPEDDITTRTAPLTNAIDALGKMLDTILKEYVSRMRSEYDKETVARICEAIVSLIQQLGIGSMNKYIDTLQESLLLLLKKDTECNRTTVNTEDEDHDIVLGDSVGDVITVMAEAQGPHFEPYFRVFLPELVKYMGRNRDDEDRRFGLGTIAECANAMQTTIQPHIQHFISFAIGGISQREECQQVKRNAIYLMGVLFEHAPQPMSHLVNQTLQELHPIFNDPDQFEDPVVDNACSTVAKMIIAYQLNLPLQQLLPALLSALPLREDYSEYRPVLDCLLMLVQAKQENAISAVLSAMLSVLATLSTQERDNVPDAQLQRIPELVKLMMRQIGGFQRYVEALSASVKDPDQRNVMLHMAQS